MTVNDLWTIQNVATPITTTMGEDVGDSTGDFIFLKPDLFTSLFSTFDGDGNRQVPPSPDTTQYKFLSHVRQINTKGMAIGGVEDLQSPSLSTIEGVEGMSFPGAGKDYVALCSLHSWTYTVQPPGMLNVQDAFEHLGQTLGLLCPPDEIIEPLRSGANVPARVASRLQDGYSLVKYRLQTGEETVALFRGPFTPTVVGRLPQLVQCSNTGQDLQILDQEVGIMDISYAAAWHLGRTLALGDQGFAAALVRLRTLIQKEALRVSKIQAVREVGSPDSFRLRTDVLRDLPTTVASLDQIHLGPNLGGGSGRFTPGAPAKRWYRPRLTASEYPALGFQAEAIQGKYVEAAVGAAQDLAQATDGTVFNETNAAVAADWQVVLAWILDRMTLDAVPAHYLITDPSHLGPESLRFFYIDANWVDAMVDGALSLGNHMGEDRDRVAIKNAINDYINHTPADQPQPPQIPTYGFYLRSDLVSMFPDLRVTTLPAPAPGTRPERAPLLRHEIVADGVMLGLFDRVPASDELTGLVFTQPSHQQRYAVGPSLNPDQVEIDVLRQYTVEQADRARDSNRHMALATVVQGPATVNNWLVWSTTPKSDADDLRLLRLPYFATQQLEVLSQGMGSFVDGDGKTQQYFDDDTATSALLAMQLNDPVYELTVPLTANPQGSSAVTSMQRLAATADKAVPRTLQLLQYARVNPAADVAAGSGVHAEPELVQAATPIGGPLNFGRHQLYRPAPSDLGGNLGPHVRAIITEPLSEALNSPRPHGVPTGTPPPLRDTDPAGVLKFTCAAYTLSPGRSSWNSANPDPQNLAQDLIFTVQVSNNDSDYNLVEFDIAIPLGPVTAGTNYLLDGYDGPGASMLSNLRFNVLWSITESDADRSLLLRLIPRSSTGWINIRQVQEFGFQLALAKVNEYENETLVTLNATAYYKRDNAQESIQSSFIVPIVKSTANV